MLGQLRPSTNRSAFGLLLALAWSSGCATGDTPKRTRATPSPLFAQNEAAKASKLGALNPKELSFALAQAEDALARGTQKTLQTQAQADAATSAKSLFTLYWAEADEYERWKRFNDYKVEHRANTFGPFGVCLIYTQWGVLEHAEKPCNSVREKYGNVSLLEVMEGRYWEKRGDVKKALKHYGQAAELNSEDVSAHLAIGNLRAAAGESGSAMKSWDRSIRAWPKCFRCYRAKAQYIEAKFGLADALPIWEKVLEIAPEDTESLTRYAHAQVGRDDKKALFAYETALKGGKKDFETYMAAAQIAVRLVMTGKAIGFLEEAVQLDKTNRDAWWMLALEYEKMEFSEKYLTALQKMLELEPTNDDVHLRLARTHFKAGDMVDALKYHRELNKLIEAGQGLLLDAAPHAAAEKERLDLLEQLGIGRGFHGGAGEVVGTVQYRANKMFQKRLQTDPALGGTVRVLVTTNAKSRVENVEVVEDVIGDPWMLANVIGNLRRAIIWGGAKRYNIELVFEK